jgi:very-short-patch-repair endonuclease
VTHLSHAYDNKGERLPLDLRIAEVARRQHGLITTHQLLTIGLDRGRISRRVAAGRLFRVHQGVYLVGTPSLSALGRDLAAVLACGEGALLSHRSAAVRWGMRKERYRWVEVTAPRTRRKRAGIRVHFGSAEGTNRWNIPITTPAQTIIDLADVVSEYATEVALGTAERHNLVDRSNIKPIRGRRGYGALTRILARDHLFTRSDLEDAFVQLIRSSDLPHPKINRRDDDGEMDAVWMDHKLIVELDGYDTHGNRAAFEADHESDVERMAEGWIVLRFTYRQVTERPEWVLTKIRRALEIRSAP